MKNIKYAILLAVFVTLVILGVIISNAYTKNTGNPPKSIKVGDTIVSVEVANTKKKRSKGLMYRESLGENEGMLFIFPYEGIHPFWMANTFIPLDILWINSSMEIVYIEENVPPCTKTGRLQSLCPSYKPEGYAKYVLEVNGGWSSGNDVVEGTIVELMKD
jgi:hypothetical protein